MPLYQDLTGNKYGKLTVLEYAGRNKNRRALWKCLCDCGNTTIVARNNLIQGGTQSCGCLTKEVKNRIGEKYGRLTVVKRGEDKISSNNQHRTMWWCKCDCGNPNLVLIEGAQLQRGYTKSCGCLKKEINYNAVKKYNRYEFYDDYVIGFTNQPDKNGNYKFYLDLEDYEKIKNICWCFDQDGYLIGAIPGKKMIKMHRIIMDVLDKPNVIISRIDTKAKNDNRKNNLKIIYKKANNGN